MAFADNLKKITLTCGEEVVLPHMTIGKILNVTHALSALVKKAKEEHPELLEFGDDWDKDANAIGLKIIKALPELLPSVADQVIDVIAAYLNKETTWVKESMDLEDLTKVIFPFFEAFTAQGNHLVGAFNKLFPKNPLDKPNLNLKTPSQN